MKQGVKGSELGERKAPGVGLYGTTRWPLVTQPQRVGPWLRNTLRTANNYDPYRPDAKGPDHAAVRYRRHRFRTMTYALQ